MWDEGAVDSSMGVCSVSSVLLSYSSSSRFLETELSRSLIVAFCVFFQESLCAGLDRQDLLKELLDQQTFFWL